jgi:hypothetical protein
MVRHFLLLTALLIAGAAFEGCVTESDAPSLFVGMSRDRLRARFGDPLRVEHTADGGEDWYYSFSSPLEVQASSDHDVVSGSDTVSVSVSNSTGTRQCPIHIRPEGYVVAPLPSGHIVR